VTDHEQGLCPRCGKPAGDFGFCEPCRSHIESLTWMPIREVMEAIDSDDPATRAQRAVLRLEQALAAVSAVAVGQTSSAAVQVDSGPRAEGTTGGASVDAAQPAQTVARFEDVMRVAPSRAPIASPVAHVTPASPVLPSVQPVLPEVQQAPAPVDVSLPADPRPAPIEEVELLVGEPAAPPPPPPQAPEPEPEPEPAPPPVAASVVPPEPAPFWFECLATVAADAPGAPAPEASAPESPAPQAECEVRSIAPPGFGAEREQPAEEDRPAVRPGADTARRTWIAALCLLLLAGLVVVLTGRAPRR